MQKTYGVNIVISTLSPFKYGNLGRVFSKKVQTSHIPARLFLLLIGKILAQKTLIWNSKTEQKSKI
jgi:hypothetical protein